MPDVQPVDFERAAECLRTLAHPGRLQLVQWLLDDRYTVGELAQRAGLAPNVASEHLKHMERCGLLASEREGRRVYYRVAEAPVRKIMQCIESRFAVD